jgi:rSAM/selenodomain-associated transferase 2
VRVRSQHNIRPRTKLLLGGLLAVLGLAALAHLPAAAGVSAGIEWLRAAGPLGALIFATAYIFATVLMLPASLLTLAAGFLYGPLWGTLLVSPVSVSAATCAFLVGRFLARDAVARRLESVPRFSVIDRAIGDRGLKIVLLLRLSPLVPFSLLNYSLGLTRVRGRDFLIGSALGMLPGTVLYVYLGSLVAGAGDLLSGAAASDEPWARALYWLGLAATLAATVILSRVARSALDGRLDAPTATSPVPGSAKQGTEDRGAPAPQVEQSESITVIIPTLNEEDRLPLRLAELEALPEVGEVIVVDGGSTDRTAPIAAAAGPRVRLLRSPRGRGVQLQTGAEAASGSVLLFLHADVQLPSDAMAWVTTGLRTEGVVAGAFRTWTVSDSGRTWMSPLLHLADLRSRYSRLPYGDQALFVHKSTYERVGGFPAVPLLEDLELSRRLRKLGKIRTVPASVRVSGRRFQARPFTTFALMNLLPIAARLGVPPDRLARFYGSPR